MEKPMPTDTITEPGIYDIPSEAYHALPHLSRTQIHNLLTLSPAHAKMLGGGEPSNPMKIGTVAHALVLGEGDRYAISPYDAWASNEAKAWKKEQEEAGILPIKRKEHDIAQAMADRCAEQISHHEIGDIFAAPGKAEQTVIWQEKGVACRCKIDWLPEDIHAIYDYKTKASASLDALQRALFRDGDYLQAHFYARGIASITGQDPMDIPLRFVVQESSPPHFINVIEMDGEALFMAEEQIEKALRIWRQCTATGEWPGYGHRVRLIDPPGYMKARWEMEKTIDNLERVA